MVSIFYGGHLHNASEREGALQLVFIPRTSGSLIKVRALWGYMRMYVYPEVVEKILFERLC